MPERGSVRREQGELMPDVEVSAIRCEVVSECAHRAPRRSIIDASCDELRSIVKGLKRHSDSAI